MTVKTAFFITFLAEFLPFVSYYTYSSFLWLIFFMAWNINFAAMFSIFFSYKYHDYFHHFESVVGASEHTKNGAP